MSVQTAIFGGGTFLNIVPYWVIITTYFFLGEGAFSKVYLAESKSDKGGLAAVKVLNSM
jgi:hypothetical protein